MSPSAFDPHRHFAVCRPIAAEAHFLSVPDATNTRMNLFDLLDDLDVLPRRFARALAGAVLLGIAFIPGFQRFYIAQAKEHSQQLVRILMHAWPAPPSTRKSIAPKR